MYHIYLEQALMPMSRCQGGYRVRRYETAIWSSRLLSAKDKLPEWCHWCGWTDAGPMESILAQDQHTQPCEYQTFTIGLKVKLWLTNQIGACGFKRFSSQQIHVFDVLQELYEESVNSAVENNIGTVEDGLNSAARGLCRSGIIINGKLMLMWLFHKGSSNVNWMFLSCLQTTSPSHILCSWTSPPMPVTPATTAVSPPTA